MDILEQHQVLCTMKLWYQKIFMGNFKEGGVLMVLPQKLEYVYIIVNIFVNTQSILKILASKYDVFNGLCLCKKTLQQCLSYEGHNFYHNDLSKCFVITLYVL